MLDFTADEMLGKPLLSFFDETNKAIIEDNKSKQNLTYEVEWTGKNRKVMTELTVYQTYDREGDVTGASSIIKDITELKKKQEELTSAYLEMDQIFSTAADGMRIIDQNKNIERVNKAYIDLLERTEEELLGSDCHSYF